MKAVFFIIVFLAFVAQALFAGAKFTNADTLQVVATGKAKKSDSRTRDQANCKEAARMDAQRIAIETLVNMNWPNVKGKVSKEKYGQKTIQTTTGSIKGGKIIRTEFDSSNDPIVCSVTFEIHRLNPATVHERTMQSLDSPDDATQAPSTRRKTKPAK